MRVNESILELIGNTPLVRLRTGMPASGARGFVKLEFLNPSGSLKDRMVYHILKKALDSGALKPGDTVIDNTSGNTGSALGLVASLMGLKAVITTPAKTSQEKVDLIRSYGVKVIVTPTEADHHDPEGCYMLARQLARRHGYFDLDQYDSQDNIDANYETTGPEIWRDTEGKVTHFVAGIGTGGTLSGAAKFLKEQNPDIQVVAVDAEGSMFAEYIKTGVITQGNEYKVEGIGSNVLTKALDVDVLDDVITVGDLDSFERARLISRTEGISGGGSSGSVAIAMEQVAQTAGNDAVIVGIFADGGIRYLSKMYNDEWMARQGYRQYQEA